MALKLRKQTAGQIQTPSDPYVTFFVDENGVPSIKGSGGSVQPSVSVSPFSVDAQEEPPAVEGNKVKLYSKIVDGQSEFFALDDVGREIQITRNGDLSLPFPGPKISQQVITWTGNGTKSIAVPTRGTRALGALLPASTFWFVTSDGTGTLQHTVNGYTLPMFDTAITSGSTAIQSNFYTGLVPTDTYTLTLTGFTGTSLSVKLLNIDYDLPMQSSWVPISTSPSTLLPAPAAGFDYNQSTSVFETSLPIPLLVIINRDSIAHNWVTEIVDGPLVVQMESDSLYANEISLETFTGSHGFTTGNQSIRVRLLEPVVTLAPIAVTLYLPGRFAQ